MASTLPQWNGHSTENPNSHVRGRRTSDNRQAIEILETKPKIEFFDVFAGLASPEITVSIGYAGKNLMLRGNRRDLMNMLRKLTDAVFKMEPGAPPDAHK